MMMLSPKVLVVAACALISSVVAIDNDNQVPIQDGDTASTRPKEGKVHTYPLYNCNDETMLGEGKDWSMPPDTCLKASTSTSFRILEPAICANGTPALLARYEGRDCNYGEVRIPGGLVNVTDDDIGECQNIFPPGYTSNETFASIASFGWYCDGRKTPRPKEGEEGSGGGRPKKGSVSLSSCPQRGDPPRAPTFNHLYPEQCKAISKGRQLKIFHAAKCADGTDAKLATWHGNRVCTGPYDDIKEIGPDMIKTCNTVSAKHDGSFAFWCSESTALSKAATRGALQDSAVVFLFAGFWVLVFFGLPVF